MAALCCMPCDAYCRPCDAYDMEAAAAAQAEEEPKAQEAAAAAQAEEERKAQEAAAAAQAEERMHIIWGPCAAYFRFS